MHKTKKVVESVIRNIYSVLYFFNVALDFNDKIRKTVCFFCLVLLIFVELPSENVNLILIYL